jgi:hypothetical protein
VVALPAHLMKHRCEAEGEREAERVLAFPSQLDRLAAPLERPIGIAELPERQRREGAGAHTLVLPVDMREGPMLGGIVKRLGLSK